MGSRVQYGSNIRERTAINNDGRQYADCNAYRHFIGRRYTAMHTIPALSRRKHGFESRRRATYARARYSNLRAPFVRHAPALRSVKIPSCAVLEWSNVLKNVAELGVNSMKGARREGKCHTGHAPGDREEALDDTAGDDRWRAR